MNKSTEFAKNSDDDNFCYIRGSRISVSEKKRRAQRVREIVEKGIARAEKEMQAQAKEWERKRVLERRSPLARIQHDALGKVRARPEVDGALRRQPARSLVPYLTQENLELLTSNCEPLDLLNDDDDGEE